MERFLDVTSHCNVQSGSDCSLHSGTFLSTVITPSLSGPLKASWNLQQKILVLLFDVLNTLNTFYEVHYDLQTHFILTKILFSYMMTTTCLLQHTRWQRKFKLPGLFAIHDEMNDGLRWDGAQATLLFVTGLAKEVGE